MKDIKTVDDLRREYPKLVKEIEDNALISGGKKHSFDREIRRAKAQARRLAGV